MSTDSFAVYDRAQTAMTGQMSDHDGITESRQSPGMTRHDMDSHRVRRIRGSTSRHAEDMHGPHYTGLRTTRQEVALHSSRRHETTRAVKVIPLPAPIFSQFTVERAGEGVTTPIPPAQRWLSSETTRRGKTWAQGQRLMRSDPGSTGPISGLGTSSQPGSACPGCSVILIGSGRPGVLFRYRG